MKDLSSFSRVRLGTFPTPIQRLDNISRFCGTNVWIKRDDMTGVGLGGNKVRKLEFLLAEAIQQQAGIVFTTGQAQSNHAMLTAACCRKLGLELILVLKRKGVLEKKGNLLLEDLMGIEVRFMDAESYDEIYAEMDRIGKERGRNYYKIPCGGSNGLGAMGYVDCAREIAEQMPDFDYIVCPEGSGGTHAGLALGQRLYLPHTKVIGMSVDTDPFDELTPAVMREACTLLELNLGIRNCDVFHENVAGSGYAIPSEEGSRAIRIMAEQEGIFLDPVYTGKAFAGLLRLAEAGAFRPEDNVLFVYTGGAGGLFAINF